MPSAKDLPTIPETLRAIQRTNGTLVDRKDQERLLRELLHKHNPALSEEQVTLHMRPYRTQLTGLVRIQRKGGARDKNYRANESLIHNLFVVSPLVLLKQKYLNRMDTSTWSSGDGNEAEDPEEEDDNGEEVASEDQAEEQEEGTESHELPSADTAPPSATLQSAPMKLILHHRRASSATAAPTRSRSGAGPSQDYEIEVSDESDTGAGSEPATPQENLNSAREKARRDISPLSGTSDSHKRKASTMISDAESEAWQPPKSKQKLTALHSSISAERDLPTEGTSGKAPQLLTGAIDSRKRKASTVIGDIESEAWQPPKSRQKLATSQSIVGAEQPMSTTPEAHVKANVGEESRFADENESLTEEDGELEYIPTRTETAARPTTPRDENSSMTSGREIASVQFPKACLRTATASPFGRASPQTSPATATAVPIPGDAPTPTMTVPRECQNAPHLSDASTQTTAQVPRVDQAPTEQPEVVEPFARYRGPADLNTPVDGRWVSKRMEAIGDDLFTAAQSYCQTNQADPAARSRFVSKPSPELTKLYASMFGDEDWPMKLSDLENSNTGLKIKQVYILLGLFGTGIRTMVLESALPWNFQEKLETGLGSDLGVLKELVVKRYHDTFENFLRAAKEEQILKSEFQDDQVAAHARTIANQLTEILRPHFMLLRKGAEPESPLDFEHWGKYLRSAISEAIIVKQMLSVSPFGHFHSGRTIIGRPLDRSLQQPKYDFGSGKSHFVFHGVLPRLSRKVNGEVITWYKALVIPFVGN